MKVAGRVFVLGIVAATYVTARKARTQMYPAIAESDARVTDAAHGRGVPRVLEMRTRRVRRTHDALLGWSSS
jgi:hypothetical protein